MVVSFRVRVTPAQPPVLVGASEALLGVGVQFSCSSRERQHSLQWPHPPATLWPLSSKAAVVGDVGSAGRKSNTKTE